MFCHASSRVALHSLQSLSKWPSGRRRLEPNSSEQASGNERGAAPPSQQASLFSLFACSSRKGVPTVYSSSSSFPFGGLIFAIRKQCTKTKIHAKIKAFLCTRVQFSSTFPVVSIHHYIRCVCICCVTICCLTIRCVTCLFPPIIFGGLVFFNRVEKVIWSL